MMLQSMPCFVNIQFCSESMHKEIFVLFCPKNVCAFVMYLADKIGCWDYNICCKVSFKDQNGSMTPYQKT